MKPCKVCSTPFTPARPLQAVCSPRCAMKHVRAQKKAEIATTRQRRAALKTIPQLIKEAQREFNAFIRERDRCRPCISCGANPPDMAQLHAGRDAGHYRSTGSASHLRFHEDNCHAQCVHCNQWGAGRAVEYRIGLESRIGRDRLHALEHDNTPLKWTRDELIAIRDTYRAKTKELRKQEA